MKKFVVLVLAVILTLSLAVPAAAASPSAPVTSDKGASASVAVTGASNVTTATTENGVTVTVEKANVTADDQKAFAEKVGDEKAAEAGMTTVLMNQLVETTSSDGSADAEGVMSFTLKTKLKADEKIIARLFDGTKWVDLDVTYDETTGKVVITGIQNAEGFDFTQLVIGIGKK